MNIQKRKMIRDKIDNYIFNYHIISPRRSFHKITAKLPIVIYFVETPAWTYDMIIVAILLSKKIILKNNYPSYLFLFSYFG
jgi:hypothetical protein